MNFLRGAAILTIAGVAVKILGSVNRIWLSRFLGGEGIGLYQMAYPIYLLFAAVASAGVPLAVSIIVAKYLAENRRADLEVLPLRLGKIFLVTGVLLTFVVYMGSEFLIRGGIITDPRANLGILAVLPAIFLAFFVGGLRGYFQGYQEMLPTAVSQVIEQLVRVFAMLILAYLLLPYGLEYAAAGAAGGAGVGAIGGLIVLLYFYRSHVNIASDRQTELPSDGEKHSTIRQLCRQLLNLAVPISLTNLVIPLTAFSDMILVPKCLLGLGLTAQAATTQFGYLAGMAQPLILLGTIPTVALSFSLVPALAQAGSGNFTQISATVRDAVKLALLISVPAGLGMSALGEPLARLLYAEPAAGPVLLHSGPALALLGLLQVSNAVLQGLGKVYWPLISLGAGLLLKIAFVLCFAGNIVDCAWATNLQYALSLSLNLWVLHMALLRQNWGDWLKIISVSGSMAAVTYFLHTWLQPLLGNGTATLLALLAAVVIYGFLIWLSGTVNCEELRRMRKWRKK